MFDSMTHHHNWCYAQIVELGGASQVKKGVTKAARTNIRFVRWEYRSVEEDAGLLK